jgi:post-segregation antitoxin (ccd killing protein)
MKTKTKVVLSVSIDKQLSELIKENMSNKSKYIEWLIYQDMKKNNVDGIEKIIL